MDKNQITGLLMIGAIMIGFFIFSGPSEEEIAAAQQYQDSVVTAQAAEAELRAQEQQALFQAEQARQMAEADSLAKVQAAYLDSVKAVNPLAADSIEKALAAIDLAQAQTETIGQFEDRGSFTSSSQGESKCIVLENEKWKTNICTQGGRISSVQLLEYKTHEGKDLYIWDDSTSHWGFDLVEGDKRFNTKDLYFETTDDDVTLKGSDSASVSFRLYADNDRSKYIEYTYGFTGDSYDLHVGVNAVGLGSTLVHAADTAMHLDWALQSPTKEKGLVTQQRASTIMYRYRGSERDYLWENRSDTLNLEERTDWVAYKQHFFSAILFSKNPFKPRTSKIGTRTIENPESKYILAYGAKLSIPAGLGSDASTNLQLFLGPNEYQTLASYDRQYDRIIDFGWGIFGYVNRWLVIPVFNILEGTGIGYGMIILILTVIVKMLLLPVMYRNYKSSARMKVIRPEIKEITDKFPDKKDAMKKQQATMALYRETGVNPLSGCWPLFIQMPILYAMFRFFPSSIELRQQGFLWAEDLANYDSILDLGFEIPIYGDHISLFTLMMAASTIFYTRMNSASMSMAGGGQPGMPNMKMMMYLFPIMMLFFFNNYSAGLSYYYFLSNLMSIGQMWLVKKYFIDEKKIRATIEANKKDPKRKKKGGFAKRLDEMQQQQNRSSRRNKNI